MLDEKWYQDVNTNLNKPMEGRGLEMVSTMVNI